MIKIEESELRDLFDALNRAKNLKYVIDPKGNLASFQDLLSSDMFSNDERGKILEALKKVVNSMIKVLEKNWSKETTRKAFVIFVNLFEKWLLELIRGKALNEIRAGLEKEKREIFESIKFSEKDSEFFQKELDKQIFNDCKSVLMEVFFSRKIQPDKIFFENDEFSSKCYVEYSKGYELPVGYYSAYLVNSFFEYPAIDFFNPTVIVSLKKFSFKEMVDLIDSHHSQKIPLYLVGSEFEQNLLSFIYRNKNDRGLQIGISSKPFGYRSEEYLFDLAVFLGTKVYDESVPSIYECLGKCERVTAFESKTVFENGKGDISDIRDRLRQIERRYDELRGSDLTEIHEKERLRRRASALSANFATIKVGGTTELERNLKFREIENFVSMMKSKAFVSEIDSRFCFDMCLNMDRLEVEDLINSVYSALYELLSCKIGIIGKDSTLKSGKVESLAKEESSNPISKYL